MTSGLLRFITSYLSLYTCSGSSYRTRVISESRCRKVRVLTVNLFLFHLIGFSCVVLDSYGRHYLPQMDQKTTNLQCGHVADGFSSTTCQSSTPVVPLFLVLPLLIVSSFLSFVRHGTWTSSFLREKTDTSPSFFVGSLHPSVHRRLSPLIFWRHKRQFNLRC